MTFDAALNRRAFVGGLASATVLASAVPARSATLPHVRIGTVPVDSYGQPYYGAAAGIFTAAGIDVEVVSLANSGAIAAAMSGGSIDVGIGSPTGIAGARLNGFPFTFFAPGPIFSVDATPTTLLMVAKDSPIKSATDLVGKTIAVDLLKSVPQVGVMTWLQKNGVDPGSVKWLELPFATMGSALAAGRIDAATIAEPALGASRDVARVLSNYSGAIAPRFFIGAWFSTEAWMKANIALAHQLTRAVSQVSAYAAAHPQDTAVVLERISKLPHDVIARIGRSPFGTKLDPAMLEAPIIAAAKAGVVPSGAVGQALIYPGFASS
jgi:NitT/TauT family transport system substrate-binding protein